MKNKKAFTLIEILVVISIIGALSTIAFASFNSAKSKAKDAKRISDLVNIRKAIEIYKIEHNEQLPPVDGWTNLGISLLASFPSGIPKPPPTPTTYYFYCTSPMYPNQYLLIAWLENKPVDPGITTITSPAGFSCSHSGSNSPVTTTATDGYRCTVSGTRICWLQ